MRPANRGPLVGFDNYARVFASSDFQNALANPVGFVIAAIILEAVIALPVALALDRGLRGTRFFQAVIALPLMVAPVVGALAWRWMFADAYGVIDSIATALGGKGPLWFSNVWLARGHDRYHQFMARASVRHPHAAGWPRQSAA